MTFAVRILVGAIFIYAGGAKIGHFNQFAAEIAGFRILPSAAVAPLAVLLPFFEVGLGLYLVLGLLTFGAAVVGGVQMLIYAAAIGSAVIRHIPAVCGCFGPQDRATADWPHVGIDVALAALCFVVARRAPGICALDSRLRNT